MTHMISDAMQCYPGLAEYIDFDVPADTDLGRVCDHVSHLYNVMLTEQIAGGDALPSNDLAWLQAGGTTSSSTSDVLEAVSSSHMVDWGAR